MTISARVPGASRGPALEWPRVALPALAAAAASVLVSYLVITDLPTGAALVAVLLLVPLVALDFQAGVAIWCGLVFIQGVPALNVAENALAGVIALTWLAAMASRQRDLNVAWSQVRVPVALTAAFALWLVLSLAWSGRPALGLTDLRQWSVAVYVMPIVATAAASPRGIRLILWGFVLGAVISVSIGLWQGLDTHSGASHLQRALDPGARLEGGERDPNFLAAGLVPALAFAAALMSLERRRSTRLLLVGAMVLMGVGLADTASRGGFVAAAVALLAAVLLVRGHRRAALGIGGLAACAVGLVVATTPAILERITDSEASEGSGRVELWTVAVRMTQDHPILGVGLNNFSAESAAYTRVPGEMRSSELLVEVPHVVHNLYLQTLVEGGLIGLLLLVLMLGAVLLSSWKAGRRLDRLAEPALAVVARCVLIGMLGMLTASVFLSNGSDKRLWILIGLAPATAALSSHVAGGRARRQPG